MAPAERHSSPARVSMSPTELRIFGDAAIWTAIGLFLAAALGFGLSRSSKWGSLFLIGMGTMAVIMFVAAMAT